MSRIINPLFVSIILYCFISSAHSADLIMVGDSTMQNYRSISSFDPLRPIYGWGEVLPDYFDPDKITVKNFARSGMSSKSFIEAGRWDLAKAEIDTGDFVIIQFGHNDQKLDDRYTNPFTVYTKMLATYVEEARALGGEPILLTPVSRGTRDSNGFLKNTHVDYAVAARIVALEMNTVLIDMLSLTDEYLLDSADDTQRIKQHFLVFAPGENAFYPDGVSDLSHTSLDGATKHAELFLQRIIELDHAVAAGLLP